jgi:ribosomal-protein-alanine N-acetyltransferase
MIFPVLKTEHLILRQLRNDDDKTISILRSIDSVNRYIERPKRCSIDDAQAFIKRINTGIAEAGLFYWAVCLEEQAALIGTVCLFNFSEDKLTAEIGYELNPDFQRKGLMNEAVKPVIDFGFTTLKLKTIEAVTHKENNSSKGLLAKNNFKPDLNKLYTRNADFIIYSLAR